jgi:methionyl-tRNA synthetase
VGCEQFYTPEELPSGLCPEHGTRAESVEEDNYFFRLSRYEPTLRALIESGTLRIEPESRRNEVLALLDSGLEDFSISRSAERARGWGIPVPDDPTQIVFVWFDALANYVSALGWPNQGGLYDRFWATSERRTHVIGKGILRFHAVYWPAILLSAGLPVPTDIWSHGYVTVEGQKIGKSLGNAIDPFELSERWGADAVRYFLLRHLHTTKDSDYSEERFKAAYDADLANQLGNLLSRSVRLFERYVEPQDDAVATETADPELAAEQVRAERSIEAAFNQFAVHEAAAAAWRYIAAVNAFVDRTAPWRLAKQGDARLRSVLQQLRQALCVVARLIHPFLPATADEIRAAVVAGCDAPVLFPKHLPNTV